MTIFKQEGGKYSRQLGVDDDGVFLLVVEGGVLGHDVDLHLVVLSADVLAVRNDALFLAAGVALLVVGAEVLLIKGDKVTVRLAAVYLSRPVLPVDV